MTKLAPLVTGFLRDYMPRSAATVRKAARPTR